MSFTKKLSGMMLAAALGVSALAAAPAAAAGTLATSPLADIKGLINASYETPRSSNRSLVLSGAVAGGSGGGVSVGLFAAGAAIRQYSGPNAAALLGPYLGAGAVVASIGASGSSGSAAATVLGLEGIGGMKFQLSDRFVLDLSGSVAIPVIGSSASSKGYSSVESGLLGLGFGINIGIGMTL